jgi:hypothetical protein
MKNKLIISGKIFIVGLLLLTISNVSNATSVNNNNDKAKNILLNVPFTSQAPLGNWRNPRQERCWCCSLLDCGTPDQCPGQAAAAMTNKMHF